VSIVVENLRRVYKQKVAVDDVSFTVDDHECFGLVGPNGAGKTTITECIAGLNHGYTGAISVLGLDPKKDHKALTYLISIQLQESSYQDKLKVKEACQLFSSLYPNPSDHNVLLERFGLSAYANTFISRLSGGLKQRLSIVLALIPRPKIVFMDELTTGLDPEARLTIWDNLEQLRDEQSVSFFLTTHYLQEAQRLCDRVAILLDGKIVALDTPGNLISSSGVGNNVIISADESSKISFDEIARFASDISSSGQSVMVTYEQAVEKQFLAYLVNSSIAFHTQEPSLEEAYFHYVEGARQE